MAYFDFVAGRVMYEENLPFDLNATQIASWQASAEIQAQPSDDDNAIEGARTSATRFTRTAGTWTASALIGKFIWSHAAGAPGSGKFLKVLSNTTAYLNVVTTYGAGELQTTGTAVLILDAATEIDAMKELQALSVWVKTA